MSRALGINKKLDRRTVKRAILEHLQRTVEPSVMPTEMIDFMEQAEIVFLDADNRPVDFTRLIVTWEK